MALTCKNRGDKFCPRCGCEVKWVRLLSGRWIAVDPQPILYREKEGRDWLVEGRKWDADILKDCAIWQKGIDVDGLKRGYRPHAWSCRK